MSSKTFPTMRQMVVACVNNLSRAEIRKIKAGDSSVAEWIVGKVLDLTPTQSSRVAAEVYLSVRTGQLPHQWKS